jgi:hypothetical protein
VSGHVFISYSRADRLYVDQLAQFLKMAGIDAWYDSEITTGDRWSAVLREQIESCDAMIVVMSTKSEASEMVENEIDFARSRGKAFVPLLLDGEPFFGLRHLQFTDVRSGALPSADFIETVRHAQSGSALAPGQRPTPARPTLTPWTRERLTKPRVAAAVVIMLASTFVLLHGIVAAGQANNNLATTLLLAPTVAALVMFVGMLLVRRWTVAGLVLIAAILDGEIGAGSLFKRFDSWSGGLAYYNNTFFTWVDILLAILSFVIAIAAVTKVTGLLDHGRELMLATVAVCAATLAALTGGPIGAPSTTARLQEPAVAAALLAVVAASRAVRVPVALGVIAFASLRIWALTANQWNVHGPKLTLTEDVWTSGLYDTSLSTHVNGVPGIILLSAVIACALAIAVLPARRAVSE